jgi:hypothetical protein
MLWRRHVGQDCILRAGFQPALVGLFTSDSGGLPTRRTQRVPLQTCPTTPCPETT